MLPNGHFFADVLRNPKIVVNYLLPKISNYVSELNQITGTEINSLLVEY